MIDSIPCGSDMVNPMEWQKKQQQRLVGSEMMYVKVMTDEQLETLRKQIAVYATICEQLIEMHKTLTTQQDLAGARMGNVYCDPLMASAGGHKITSRQRWTPTPVQLQILEQIFEQGNGTPTKEKIKDIAAELSKHGQISESNVYNWFQNRRARSKRKQQNLASSSHNNTTESEVETEVDSKDKKTKPDDFESQHRVTNGDGAALNMCFQNPQVCSDLQYLTPESNKPESMFPSDDSTRNFGHVPVFSGMLSNPRSDYLAGKMEAPDNYNLYQQEGDYNMTG